MPAFVPVTNSLGQPVLTSSGSPRVACQHLSAWLVAYDALQVARGRGHVTYYQTVGGADASAGTHLCGSAWDMAYRSDAAIMDAREMGAAIWHRIPGRNGWPSSGADHVHGLIMCGDNSCNAYQYAAYWLGYNGLGLNGVGAGDPLPKPSMRRNWQEGIDWAHAQMEDDMDATQASQLANIYAAIFNGGTSMKDGGKSISQSLAEIQATLKAPALTDAQNNALMSTWQAVFSGGGDAGPQSMIARLTELQEQAAKIVAELQGTTPTVTVNIDDAAAERIATAVWAPIKNGA